MHSSMNTTLALPANVTRLLVRVGILPTKDANPEGMVFKQHATTAEARAKIMDECAHNHLKTGIITHPEYAVVKDDDDERRGNSTRSTMYYLTGAEMIKCIGLGANATALHEFFAVRCAIDHIHDKIYKKLSNAYNVHLEKEGVAKDSEIAQLKAIMQESLRHTSKLIDKVDTQTEMISEQTQKIDHQTDIITEVNGTVLSLSRRVPVQARDSNRDPCLGMTYFLYDDKTNGPTIRIIPMIGQRKRLFSTMTKLIVGDYDPNRRLIIRTKHQMAFAPIYAPDQRNWVDLAKGRYEALMHSRIKVAKDARTKTMRSATGRMKTIRTKIQNCEFNLLREQSLITAHLSTNDLAKRNATIAELETNLQTLLQSLADTKAIHTQAKDSQINVPINFKLSCIDFKSNDYMSLNELIGIFYDLIVETHGCVFLKSMNEELQQLATQHRSEFINELGSAHMEAKQELISTVEATYLQMSERLMQTIETSVLSDSTEEDDKTEEEIDAEIWAILESPCM